MNNDMEASALVDGPLYSVLSITFSGPYLFDFRDGLKVDIYAPYCPLHEAGFFYSDNSRSETDLWACAQSGGTVLSRSDRKYEITGSGIQMNPWPPTIIRQVQLPYSRRKEVSFLATTKSEPCAPRFDKMLFRLSVPVPKYVYPLYTDLVEVLDGYGTPPGQRYKHYATGLRFFYGWDGASDVHLIIPSQERCKITPPVFNELPTMADIGVRYSGPEVADPNDPHSDARSCFASLTTLAGYEKWLNYGDCLSSPTNPSHGSGSPDPSPSPCADIGEPINEVVHHTGGDCHAPVIALGLDGV